MVVLIPMLMLLLLMMPLRHCREHLLTNGFGHRRHFDVPLCPLNSIPVVEFWRRWWAAAAPGHNTLIHCLLLSQSLTIFMVSHYSDPHIDPLTTDTVIDTFCRIFYTLLFSSAITGQMTR